MANFNIYIFFLFKAELKRLYASLYILKTKTIHKDNPHLIKKHGQKRKNRRFSMQAFQRHGVASVSGVGEAISTIFGSGLDKHDHDTTKIPEGSTSNHNEMTNIC